MPNCWWVETGHFSHIYREHQNTQGQQSRWHVNTITPGRKGSRGNHAICIHNVIGARSDSIRALPKAPQPPLSHSGAAPDSDRAKKPRLTEPAASNQELNPRDRVEGLGDFGKPTGEFGTVAQTNEDDAVVKWEDDGRMRLRQPWLKKV